MLKKCCISLFCLLSCTISAISLPSLTSMPNNSNQKTRLLYLSGRVVEGEITDDGANNVKVTLKLKLDIKNVGSKPALLLKREPVVVEDKIIADPADAREDKYLFLSQTFPSIARNVEWEELQRRINKPIPPPDLIRELAPEETLTLEVERWFYVSKKTNLDPQSKSWDMIRQASPAWLQVTLQVWSGDIEPNVDRSKLKFSRMLKRRWAQVGELQLEGLTSEPMPLYFSSFALNNAARKENSARRQR